MKAQEIMMFLLLFNLSVSVVGALSIYNIGVTPPEDKYNVTNVPSTNADDITYRFLGDTIGFMVVGIVAGAMTSWLTRIPTDAGAAYGFFSGLFWGVTVSTIRIIWSIGNGFPGATGANLGILVIIFIFHWINIFSVYGKKINR